MLNFERHTLFLLQMTLAFVGGESKALNSAIPIFWYHMGTLVGIISTEQNTLQMGMGMGFYYILWPKSVSWEEMKQDIITLLF